MPHFMCICSHVGDRWVVGGGGGEVYYASLRVGLIKYVYSEGGTTVKLKL